MQINPKPQRVTEQEAQYYNVEHLSELDIKQSPKPEERDPLVITNDHFVAKQVGGDLAYLVEGKLISEGGKCNCECACNCECNCECHECACVCECGPIGPI